MNQHERLPPFVTTALRGGMAAGICPTWDEAFAKAFQAARTSRIRHRVHRTGSTSDRPWHYGWARVEVSADNIRILR